MRILYTHTYTRTSYFILFLFSVYIKVLLFEKQRDREIEGKIQKAPRTNSVPVESIIF